MGVKLSLSSWEEHRLRMSGNKVPKRICEFKQQEITGQRKLHNEELIICDLHQILLRLLNQGV
jgi:hypothetical protein